MNTKYHLGLRAAKTSIAVLICVLLALLFRRADMFFSSIATIICMRQTYNETYNAGISRLIGTSIGGAVGLIVLLISQHIPCKFYATSILAPLFVLAVIYICNFIEFKASVEIACIVLLSVIMVHSDAAYNNTFFYVVNRVLDTSMGIVVSMFVNKFFFKNKSKITKNNLIEQSQSQK